VTLFQPAASAKWLLALRGQRCATLLGHALVAYVPDPGLVADLLAIEKMRAQERSIGAFARSHRGIGFIGMTELRLRFTGG
jgi:hypothetical protein